MDNLSDRLYGPLADSDPIHPCTVGDFEAIYETINDAAQAYRGVIPSDRWKEPYMPREELREEIEAGVVFWGYKEKEQLLGVMGLQPVQDVTLIRHSYVHTARRNQGIGGKLLSRLKAQTDRPLLVGTWAAAVWAIRFYEKHGFRLVSLEEKSRLLKRYWSIADRQVETSVVLADPKWLQGIEGREWEFRDDRKE
jgi:GNAT superfamily N-acetyltransferase